MKTCLITGTKSGTGRSGAIQIAEKCCLVLLVYRSLDKGLATKEALVKKTQNE